MDDGGKVASGTGYQWNRIAYISSDPVQPEWYGCTGKGSNSPDTINFQSMVNGLSDNDTVELGTGKEYYNGDPNGAQWIITKNNITIIGNSSTLSKRPSLSTDNFTVILDINGVNGFSLLGTINLNGNEPYAEIFDSNGVNLNAGVKYCNSPCTSFCVRIQNSTNIVVAQSIKMTRAVFCAYLNNVTTIDFKGTYTFSGQVFPLKSTDGALGSAAKFNGCSQIFADIIASNCAYSGLEMEGGNNHGSLRCIGTNNYQASIHFHNGNSNFTVDSISINNVQYSLFLGYGSAAITGRAKGTGTGHVCFCFGSSNSNVSYCNIEIDAYNSKALSTYDTTGAYSIIFCKFKVLCYSTDTVGSAMNIASVKYSKVEFLGQGFARAMTLSSGTFNEFDIKVPYGTGTVYQNPGYQNNFEISRFNTSETTGEAQRFTLRYESGCYEGAPNITGNSPEVLAARYAITDTSVFFISPNMPSGSTLPPTLPIGAVYVDTGNDNVLKMRKV